VISAYNKKETLYLLKDITGYFRPGTMAALMGPSGSGKVWNCVEATQPQRTILAAPAASFRRQGSALLVHLCCAKHCVSRMAQVSDSADSSDGPCSVPCCALQTTLLDLLAGRKTVGKTEGDILFAGNKPTRPFLRRYTGYVEQFGACLTRCVLAGGPAATHHTHTECGLPSYAHSVNPALAQDWRAARTSPP
jgi:hypothetical protein